VPRPAGAGVPAGVLDVAGCGAGGGPEPWHPATSQQPSTMSLTLMRFAISATSGGRFRSMR